MLLAEGLRVLEASSCESCLDDLGPLLAVGALSDFLPLDNPSAVNLVSGPAPLHASETVQVEPSLELLKFGFVDFSGMLLNLLGRKIVAFSIDDCCESFVSSMLCLRMNTS